MGSCVVVKGEAGSVRCADELAAEQGLWLFGLHT